jgi:hypothetical protein
MLSRKVSLHDIEDVEAFVIMCVKRSGTPREQWEDMVCEGLCLIYAMAGNYKAQLEGYASKGRFSGYAIKWLPKQISQAYHRNCEHHLYLTDPTSKQRGWVRLAKPVSYSWLSENGVGNDESRFERRIRPLSMWETPPKESSG